VPKLFLDRNEAAAHGAARQKAVRAALLAAYAAFLVYVYYFRNASPYSRGDLQKWGEARGFGTLFNFVPLRNILNYTVNSSAFNFSTLVYNLVYPILIYIPLGVLVFLLFGRAKPLKTNICFLLPVVCLLLPRPFLLVGFFDVDKVLLAAAGFNIGGGFVRVMDSQRKKILGGVGRASAQG
jgi:glycopeptide antibiotics resistance protein